MSRQNDSSRSVHVMYYPGKYSESVAALPSLLVIFNLNFLIIRASNLTQTLLQRP